MKWSGNSADLTFWGISMRKTIILAALAATVALTACNTVAGAGKDVSSVGKATTKAAKDTGAK